MIIEQKSLNVSLDSEKDYDNINSFMGFNIYFFINCVIGTLVRYLFHEFRIKYFVDDEKLYEKFFYNF